MSTLPMCKNCGESMICRMRTKTVGDKKIVVRNSKGEPQKICFFPCKCKNHS